MENPHCCACRGALDKAWIRHRKCFTPAGVAGTEIREGVRGKRPAYWRFLKMVRGECGRSWCQDPKGLSMVSASGTALGGGRGTVVGGRCRQAPVRSSLGQVRG